MTATVEIQINGNWPLKLLPHRASLELWQTGWERIRLDSMFANLKPGMLVYDIGSEEGDFPALWASWGCDVAMFEPNKRVWANIKAVWEANDLPAPAATWEGFAADKDYTPEGTRWGNSVWPQAAYGPTIDDHGFCVIHQRPDIRCIKVDTMAYRTGFPDAITMDVEGAELSVLRGARDVLSGSLPPLLWISVHPAIIADEFKQKVTDIWDLLREFGYKWRLLDYDHELHCFAWHPDKHDVVLPE